MHRMPNDERSMPADRRAFLRTALAGAGTLAAMRTAFAAGDPQAATAAPAAAPPASGVTGTIRLAHLTDIPVPPELGAEAGMAAAFMHAQEQ